MTPDAFVLEYWKVYEAYMGRKEHLIEVTTTLYLAFVSALLLQSWEKFWLVHAHSVAVLALVTMLLVLLFVSRQFRWWSDAAMVSDACQTLTAEWLLSPHAAKDLSLVELPSSRRVKVPKVVAERIQDMMNAASAKSCCDKVGSAPFEVVVYGLGAVWTMALAVQCYWAIGVYHRGVTLAKWLTLIGGSSLLIGLVAALVSNRYTATKGLLVAKNPLKQGGLAESPKDHAECWFYIGLSLTAVGVILQTLGSLLPP